MVPALTTCKANHNNYHLMCVQIKASQAKHANHIFVVKIQSYFNMQQLHASSINTFAISDFTRAWINDGEMGSIPNI